MDLNVIPRYVLGLQLSFLVTLFSVPLLAWLRMSTKVGKFTVEWKDNRGSRGELEISYSNSRGKRRRGLIVDRVEARPSEPLYSAGYSKYSPVIPVMGTNSSLIIDFKNMKKISLGLGFRNSEEMNKVYEQLK